MSTFDPPKPPGSPDEPVAPPSEPVAPASTIPGEPLFPNMPVMPGQPQMPLAPVDPSMAVAPGPPLAPAPPRPTFRERLRRVGGFFARAGAGFESFALGMAEAFTGWVPWPVVLGLGLGGGVWALSHRARWGALFENKLDLKERLWTLPWLGGGIVVMFLFMTVAHLLTRRREELAFADSVRRWGPRLAFVLALPLIASLLTPAIQKESPPVVLLHCALGALCVLISGYAWARPRAAEQPAPAPASEAVAPIAATLAPESAPAPASEAVAPAWKPTGGVGRWLAAVWVAFLWLGHAATFSYLALVQHFSLSTRTIDLGYYDNIFYQSIHGRWLACSFLKTGNHAAAHFDPILVVLSPLYLLYPRAELLLVLQSVWIGSGAIPVYLIAHRRLQSRLQAGAIAVAYALHPALQGANMYEFHSLSLVAPVLLWLLNFLEKGSARGYFITLAVLLLCREDASLLSCFVGLAAIVAPSALAAAEDASGAGPEERARGEKRRRRMGLITILVAVTYFVVVKLVFMTSADILNSGKDAYSFAYYYEDLIPKGSGMGGLVLSLVGNPAFVMRHVFTEAKLVYLATVFMPVLFLPFAARAGRWVLAYGLIFCLLASRTAVFSTHFQYSTLLYPAAIAFAPAALAALRGRPAGFFGKLDMRKLSVGLVPAIVMATLLVSWQFGGIVPNGRFKAGFYSVRRMLTDKDKEQYAWVKSAVAQIPRDARVSVTDRMGPHVSNRRYAYFYPSRHDVDFVFIDEGDLKGNEVNRHRSVMAKGQFKEVTRKGKIVLYKRVK
ncbi:MAG: DUF2079 domain-containing protein [Polyangiaceae bacterium]